jgi:hypothetical protein
VAAHVLRATAAAEVAIETRSHSHGRAAATADGSTATKGQLMRATRNAKATYALTARTYLRANEAITEATRPPKTAAIMIAARPSFM